MRSAASKNASHAATRGALLHAAADVFAEVGFRGATVRDICRRAGANVAAVSYHFGDKAGLYSEVLAEQSRLAQSRYPVPTGDTDPAAQLGGFIRSFLQRVLSPELHARHGRIMAREMVEPTAALDRLVAEAIRPQSEMLREIVSALLGGAADPARVRLCGMSVVGQILFYCHCRPVIDRLFPGAELDATGLDRLTTHITAFSLAGIRGFAATAAPSRPGRPARTRRRADGPSASGAAKRTDRT